MLSNIRTVSGRRIGAGSEGLQGEWWAAEQNRPVVPLFIRPESCRDDFAAFRLHAAAAMRAVIRQGNRDAFIHPRRDGAACLSVAATRFTARSLRVGFRPAPRIGRDRQTPASQTGWDAELQAVREALAAQSPCLAAVSGRSGRRTVGRVLEWEQLHDSLRTISDGHTRLVCLAGEPGIGKTTLLDV